jgi:hypothetical protein
MYVRISGNKRIGSAFRLFDAGLLHGLLFDPQDGGGMFVRNVG